MREQEQMMKSELADAVSNRRYDRANELKKELLVLKKKIMRERRMKANRLSEIPKDALSNFQTQMNSLIENTYTESTEDDEYYDAHYGANHTNSNVDDDDIDAMKSFDVDCDNGGGRVCKFFIYSGSVRREEFDTERVEYRYRLLVERSMRFGPDGRREYVNEHRWGSDTGRSW